MSRRARKPRVPAPVIIDRAPDDLVRVQEVLRRTGLSRPTLYRKIASGTFPRQVQLSENCVAWYERDLAAFQADPAGWRDPSAAA